MSHLKYMLLGGAGLFGVLVLLGLPAQTAVFLAIALACPLMMVFMMAGDHSSHEEGAPHHGQGHQASTQERSDSSPTHRHH